MFDGIRHIGYLVADLDKGVQWFARAFGAVHTGGGTMQPSPMFPAGGRNAFVEFGGVEAELMQPADTSPLAPDALVMHHVGYVVADIAAAAAKAKAKGLRFLAEAPYTNFVGQEVLYFDPASTNGAWMHLTRIPDAQKAGRPSSGPHISSILHPGYLVRDAEAAAQWYVEKLGGVRVGGGPSRRGGRVAFVDCGGAQIELIEPEDTSSLGSDFVLDHVGYVTTGIDTSLGAWRGRGLAFQTEAPVVNPIG
ncbi:MAG: VOC family protein, partial [Hyphomicrobiaceae bacterium]